MEQSRGRGRGDLLAYCELFRILSKSVIFWNINFSLLCRRHLEGVGGLEAQVDAVEGLKCNGYKLQKH